MTLPTSPKAVLPRESCASHRVGRGFIALYVLAFMSTNLVFLAPLLVTLPLKVNGVTQAPNLGYNVVMKLSH